MEIQLLDSPRSRLAELVALWHGSVLASHDFVKKDDLEDIHAQMPQLLSDQPELWLAVEGGKLCGFMACDGAEIAMLFVAAGNFGRGIGSRLLAWARGRHGPLLVDVNAGNLDGLRFYRKHGFLPVAYSPVDGQGRPYGIYKMRQL